MKYCKIHKKTELIFFKNAYDSELDFNYCPICEKKRKKKEEKTLRKTCNLVVKNDDKILKKQCYNFRHNGKPLKKGDYAFINNRGYLEKSNTKKDYLVVC